MPETKNPADHKPDGPFSNLTPDGSPGSESDSVPGASLASPPSLAAAAGTDGKTFRLSLWRDGVQQGWLATDSNYWVVLGQESSRTERSRPPWTQNLEWYTYQGVNYIRAVKPKMDLMTAQGPYLSVSYYSYVGFYQWVPAKDYGWKVDGKNLISDYNNKKLSLQPESHGVQYICAWNEYPILEVRFEPSDPWDR